MVPRTSRKKAAQPTAAPRPIQSRAATRANPAAPAIIIGCEDQPELRDAEVELRLEDRQADEQPAEAEQVAQLAAEARHGGGARTVRGDVPAALLLQHEPTDDRQAGAGDEHEVGGAPERDVLAEEPVPDVVEREAEQRVEAGARDEQPTDRSATRTG